MFKGDLEGDLEKDLEGDLVVDLEGDYKGDFSEGSSNKLRRGLAVKLRSGKVKSGLVQFWFS